MVEGNNSGFVFHLIYGPHKNLSVKLQKSMQIYNGMSNDKHKYLF